MKDEKARSLGQLTGKRNAALKPLRLAATPGDVERLKRLEEESHKELFDRHRKPGHFTENSRKHGEAHRALRKRSGACFENTSVPAPARE